MNSLVMKSIYAGLGLLGSGKDTVEDLGRKLAKRADLSEKDGEKIARTLRQRSQKAILALEKTLDEEVSKVLHGVYAATQALSGPDRKKPKSRVAKRPKSRRTRTRR